MKHILKYATLAFLTLIILSTITALPTQALSTKTANAYIVKEIKTSRDAWGTIYFNQTFYVDVVLDVTSEIPGPKMSIAMVYGGTTYELNATRIGTTYTYRVWLNITDTGELHVYEADPTTGKISTEETITPRPTLEEGDSLTFIAYGKQVTLTVSHQTPTIKALITEIIESANIINVTDWELTAPDLNYGPLTLDNYTDAKNISVYIYKEGATPPSTPTFSVEAYETDTNSGVFKLKGWHKVTTNISDVFGVSAGDTLILNFTVPIYPDASKYDSVIVKLSVVKVPTVTITTDRKEIPLSPVPVKDEGGVVLYINVTDYSVTGTTTTIDLRMYTRGGVPVNASKVPANELYYDASRSPLTFEASTGILELTLTRIGDTHTFGGQVVINTSILDKPEYIGGWLLLNYSGTTSKLYLKVYSASLSTNATTVKYGDVIEIKLYDLERNLNTTAKDKVNVTVDGADQTYITLTETDVNTGIFIADITIGVNITGVLPGASFSVSYTDERSPRTPETAEKFLTDSYTLTYSVQSFVGSVKTDKTTYGPYETVTIIINDWDANRDPTSKDTISKDKIYIIIGAKQIHPPDDAVETDVNTGAFEVEVTPDYLYKEATGETPATLKDAAKYLLQAGNILVMYSDDYTPEGPKVLQTSFSYESYDPQIITDKKAYNIGDKMNITIVDPDANVNSDTIDSVTVILKSTSYPVGTEVTLYETDVDTGVFTGTVIVSDTQVGAGYIYAKFGDIITIEYTDELPADFGVTGEAKTFTHTVRVGVVVEKPIKPQTPSFVEPTTGTPVTPTVGKSVMIKIPLTNVGTLKETFTVVMIIRDTTGAAIYISMASLPLGGGETAEIGFTYTPTAAGTYTIEVHIIKSLADWTPVGESLTATMTVTE